jgi:hypothetical protein
LKAWIPAPALVILILLALTIGAHAACPTPGQCGKWVLTYHPPEITTDYLGDSSFDELMKDTSFTGSAYLEGGNIESSPGSAQTKKADQKASQKPVQKGPAPGVNFSGKWLFKLLGSSKSISLILIPTEDRIHGYGTLVETDKDDIPAAATGSVSDDGLSLDVKPTTGDRTIQCKISLSPGSDSKITLVGGYEILSGWPAYR